MIVIFHNGTLPDLCALPLIISRALEQASAALVNSNKNQHSTHFPCTHSSFNELVFPCESGAYLTRIQHTYLEHLASSWSSSSSSVSSSFESTRREREREISFPSSHEPLSCECMYICMHVIVCMCVRIYASTIDHNAICIALIMCPCIYGCPFASTCSYLIRCVVEQ